MKKISFIFIISAVLIGCKTQQSQVVKSIPLDENNYINSITESELKTHLTIVASDKMKEEKLEVKDKKWLEGI